MASNAREKASGSKVLKVTYRDLIRYPKHGGEPEQVEPRNPEWDLGIACIQTFQSQGTSMSLGQQEEMLEIIRGLHYVIPRSAIGAPTSHKLYKTTIKKAASDPESISWPIFLILSTLYNKLPAKYINEILRVHGRTSTDDLTSQYLALEGMEPAEPVMQQNTNATKQSRQTISIADTHPTTISDDDSDAERQETVSPMSTRRQRQQERARDVTQLRKDIPTKQPAAGQVPCEDIDDSTSSAVSGTDSSETSEYSPVDNFGMNRLGGQKRRILLTTTGRKRTTIKRQARRTNEDASPPTTAAPAGNQSRLSAADAEEFRRDIAVIKEQLSQILLFIAGANEKFEQILKEVRDNAGVKEKIDEILKELKDAAKYKKFNANIIQLLSTAAQLSQENENNV
ncbi:hypothetical protein THAR02_08560 [Trichoderma harzianum]|uniref:Uncharacterized protein n=1 Tax=Trichoderma harzianum TaxID=5544 RepID=A0A0F9ZG73_TRIHA|nr:hypothetical protein THAR02_08560 [Trichoderma harzianum]